VIALYNPASRARPKQIHNAFEILRQHRTAAAVTMFARAVGRADEQLIVTTLGAADPAAADMRTLVLVGSAATRCIERAGDKGGSWVYSPRRWEAP